MTISAIVPAHGGGPHTDSKERESLELGHARALEVLTTLVPLGAGGAFRALSTSPVAPVLSLPRSACAAGFQQLARLVRRAGVRSVAVLSPGRGEGKSFCALNLALAMAEQQEQAVALLDAHTDSPSLADWLEVDVRALQGGTRPTGAAPAQEAGTSNLTVLALRTRAASRLTGPGVLAAVEGALAPPVSCLIVDGPAVLNAPDAALLADHVDAVVLCAAAERTRRKELVAARALLSPSPVLASVLMFPTTR